MPGWIGPWELAILLVIVLLVFGPKRLPEMGRSLGRGMREFKSSITGGGKDDDAPEELAPPPALEQGDGRVEQLAEELRVERRERVIDQAIHDGRISADEADDYRKLYDAAPESAVKAIEKLPARATSSEPAS
jgi:sec-independent protein translocase protein TatA